MSASASSLESGRMITVVRCFAGVRLGYMTTISLVTLIAVGTGERLGGGAIACVVFATAYGVGVAVLALRRPWSLPPWRKLAAIDASLVGALTVAGFRFSVLSLTFLIVPILIGLIARPLATFLWSTAPVAIMIPCGLVMLAGATTPHESEDAVELLWYSGLFAVPALCGAAFSAVRVRIDRSALENARRELLAATIVRVEARERHELADALHDGPVQHLAAAYREMTSSLHGGDARIEDARAAVGTALEQLRGEIFDLYPHVLDHAGLAGAVAELVRRSEERGGFTTSVDIDPRAVGVDDVTVIAVLRELLTNIAKHAEAAHVDVTVSNDRGVCLRAEVCDDGRGFAPQPPEHAVQERHFGLRSMGDRLLALGGALEISSELGSGTRACARIPISRLSSG